jgi:hypothetical protein
MTLYFRDNTEGTALRTRVAVDGDLSGVTAATPNGYVTYRLQLTSRYTNRSIDNDTSSWLLPIELQLSNERYSEFNVQPYLGAGSTVELGLYTGLYDYEIWGSELDIDWTSENFDEGQWSLLQNGQTKIKSTTTVDMQRGSDEAITVKYKTEPNTAKSYVIYK